jgi:outer membrane protein assembly factor BamB
MTKWLRWILSVLTTLCVAVLCWVVANPSSSASTSSGVFAAGVPSLSVADAQSSSPRSAASLALPVKKLIRSQRYGPLGYLGDVVTYHYNVARQGFTQFETVLNLSNVNSNTFGLVGFFPVDGKVDAQPLYLYKVPVGPNLHNILYVATENDSVYAFDADHGQQLWKASALLPGETPSDDLGCPLITPTIGITAAPVIDRQRGMIYLVAMTKDSTGNYHQRLHVLDLSTGAERLGAPIEIQASYPGTGDGSINGLVLFDPSQYAARAALLEYGGKIYFAFTSHCDHRPYTGWLMAYDVKPLQQASVLNLTPNGNSGAVWMSGAGLAADGQSNIYLLSANGTFDTTLDNQGMPINGDYGNSFVKISISAQLAVADYFTMQNTLAESDDDTDLGSGGALVLPDLYDNQGGLHHLAVGAGKDGNLYVVNRDDMGKFDPDQDNIYQEILGALPQGVFAAPAYYNNTVYYGDVNDTLKAFSITNAMLSTSPTSQTQTLFPYPGTTPSVSANLGSDAIVWAVENSDPAVLHAYDATNLAHELYNSNQAGSRDQFGPGNKFITPVIVNGKVFVGTQTGVAEFGLLQ